MVFGVAVFSHILTEFITIIETIKIIEVELGELDKLAQFFGILVHFNEDKPINYARKKKIEDYFQYRWDNDLNFAVTDEEGA